MRRLALTLALLSATVPAASASAQGPKAPPADAGFDYQIGGDYPLPAGVSVVSRDWFAGAAVKGATYSICYVNAFQTQADENGADRPDEQSNWPRKLVLTELGDDPKWGGEYLVDISGKQRRKRAAAWIEQMVDGCARKGFDAVEFDNLDSWTRFDGTPLADDVPFGKRQAVAFARLIARYAHGKGLAVALKNTADLSVQQVRRAGFDFAVVEECGRYDECDVFRRAHGDDIVAIEYRRKDFAKACESVGDEVSVVLRDRNVSPKGSRGYAYDSC